MACYDNDSNPKGGGTENGCWYVRTLRHDAVLISARHHNVAYRAKAHSHLASVLGLTHLHAYGFSPLQSSDTVIQH